VSRVRENRMPGSMRRREESGTSRACTLRTVLAPPADPTTTDPWLARSEIVHSKGLACLYRDASFPRDAGVWAN
jgi:hypothetical protein